MMDFIEVFPWNENFEVGIEVIDTQHKRLVQLLNLLASHIAYQSDAPTLKTIFNELAEYAVYHFKTEEAIWHDCFANDLWESEHKAVHNSFIENIGNLKAEDGVKPLEEVIEEVLSFLTHWLAFHILDSDMRMSKVAKGVQQGLPLGQAKKQAEHEMSGAMKVLIETILYMYDSLSSRTLQLMREVMERQKAESKLRLAANVFDNTLDAICITDEYLEIIDANPVFYQLSGYGEDDVLGKPLAAIKSAFANDKIAINIWETVATQGHWSGITSSRDESGEVKSEWLTLSSIKDTHGGLTNYVAVFSNVSHLLKKQDKLERIAHYDALTGLPNRLLFSDRMGLAMAHAERTGNFLAICYLDLDGFKPINDTLGHAAGDYLLKELSQRFLNVVRSEDTVARLGGDEFVLLFGDLKHADDYKVLLERLLEDIAAPVLIQENIAHVSASIGVTLFPIDKGDADTLLQHADEAMYEAKRQGKSRYCVYSM
ncbi:MAG: bacteriohemerythrin [Methylococcaceae bacterium]|nr:bacteriohemerythrin [Methylococcaceae bacterium]